MALHKKKMITLYVIIIFFVILDRFFKFLAINGYFKNGISIFGDFFKLNFAANYNIAFSLPFNGIFLNILIIFIILGLIYNLIYVINKKRPLEAVFLISVIWGATSNFMDRLKHGYVIDYLDLSYFTIFNIADAMIVLGVVGAGWMMLDKNKKLL